MKKPIRVLTVFGTRPEAIKMAPLARALSEDAHFDAKVCVTGQHRQMLDQVLELFQIVPDYDLDVMLANQTLNGLSGRIFVGIDPILEKENPDWVLVHGDTTTAMTSALAAFHRKIRVAHVEAGLRTYDFQRPWPEELNRTIIDVFSDMLFPPTLSSKKNIERERRNGSKIYVTGNTVIDALKWVTNRLKHDENLMRLAEKNLPPLDSNKKTLLVTGHRRENFGSGFLEICNALAQLAKRTDLQIVYPVHLNPNVQAPVSNILGNLPNVHLIAPLDYISFVMALQKCDIVLTDSGGVQEEAPSLGKPVLVMRDVTERPEAVEAGTVELVGASAEKIFRKVTDLIDDSDAYRRFSLAHNPYGDGQAVPRILKALKGEAFREFQ